MFGISQASYRDKLIWQSGSNGKGVGPYRLMMQPDGNLVIYDSKNTATWATGTNGKGSPPYKLKMRKDMSLEIKSSTGIIWTNKYVLDLFYKNSIYRFMFKFDYLVYIILFLIAIALFFHYHERISKKIIMNY